MLPDLTDRPRVGYVLKMYPRFSETFIVTELVQMQRLGIDLEVFSLRTPTEGRFHASLAELRAPVTYLPYASVRGSDLWLALQRATCRPELTRLLPDLLAMDVRDATQALELAELIQARDITHLHAHFASVAADVARVAAALTGITYSITAHAKDIFHAEVDTAALRRKLRDAHDVVTVSEFNLAYLRAHYGSDASRVRRVYNGLDLPSFPWSDPGRRPPVIAAVGRLVEKKGFGDLLRAAALLKRAGRDFTVEIVGTGEQQTALSALHRELDLADRVRFLGPLPQEQVVRVVAGAAAFAAPCAVGEDGNRDGLPTVLLEAMALGTPCVTTPVTGIPEVVRHESTGLLVGEHDPEALAAALDRLLLDAALRRDLSLRARDLIEREFDAQKQAALVAQAFVPVHRSRLQRQESVTLEPELLTA
jgi:colanic acid/amylovoran biosynthesis glycosyltransferase